MDNTQVTKRKIGALIAKNLIVMLVAVIVALTGVLAWFTNNTSAEANGISVECQAPDGVEIAIVEHDKNVQADKLEYTSNITLVSGEGVLANLNFQEVTGDGVSFLRPALTQQNGVATPNKGEEWREATAGQDYLCFDLYMRTRDPKNICLRSSSSFTTIANPLSWSSNYAVTDKDNASTYGDFSRDAIVGATRASVVGYDSTAKSYSDNRLLWIPRTDICLTSSGNNYTLKTGITDADKDLYGTFYHYYYDSSKNRHNAAKENINVYPKIDNSTPKTHTTLGEDVVITSFKNTEDNAEYINGYWYVHVVYNTWIEGEDNESRLALADGKFKINLQLIAKLEPNETNE